MERRGHSDVSLRESGEHICLLTGLQWRRPIPVPAPTCCMILGESLKLSEPHLSFHTTVR